jgi:hypothetical protein
VSFHLGFPVSFTHEFPMFSRLILKRFPLPWPHTEKERGKQADDAAKRRDMV